MSPADESLETGRRGAVPPYVLAVDVGSSSVKAALFDGRARRIAGTLVRVPYAQEVTPEGGVSVDAERLEGVVAGAIERALARGGRPAAQVRAVGFACFFHSLLGLDAEGAPRTPVLSWADTTSAPAVHGLAERVDPAEVHARTGATLHSSFWPARLRYFGDRGVAVDQWTGFGEWLVARATGHHRSTISMASGTGIFDRTRDDWDAELLRELGVRRGALPEIEDDHEAAAPARRRARGIARGGPLVAVVGDLPWYGPWGDGLAGNIGMGCVGAVRASLMVGTSGAMRLVLDGGTLPPPRGLFAYRWGRDRTLLGGALSEGGNVGAWVTHLTGRPTRSLDAEAWSIPGGAHGLHALPFVAGERSPGYRSHARAVVAGLTLATGAAELYRGLVEAVALRFRWIDAALSNAARAAPQVVVGGGAVEGSTLWRQAIADALGREVERSSVDEVSLRGAAILVLLALAGPLQGAERDRWLATLAPPPGQRVRPDPAGVERSRVAAERQAVLEAVLDG